MIDEKVHIEDRVAKLRARAAERCNIEESECHLGHVSLQAMLDEPNKILQIDAVTGGTETYKSVARRACRLASAMTNSGMKPGDAVVLMSTNHLDLCIPYYACHFNGYSMCAVDTSLGPDELGNIFPFIQPKMIFSIKSCADKIHQALKVNKLKTEAVIFDDKSADLEVFVGKYFGTQVNFRPALFNQSETIAWLMLTSGTTGSPKVAMMPFDTLLNGMIQWWKPFTDKSLERVMALVTLQWLSSLVFFTSTPLRGFTRVQSSEPLTPQTLIGLINKYRPNGTAWSPYLLGQFIGAAAKHCDMSCFKIIIIGGSAIEKPLLDQVKSICPANLCLVYGMTELLVPVFDFDESTPFGSTGKPKTIYEFKIMDENNAPLIKPFKTGELWIKGNAFFKGYLNNPEETAELLTSDGWFKTGDMFYRDDQDYYYFVERKRLIIKHFGFKLSPLQMEEIIKRHPGVEEACVVGLPEVACLERPTAAILKKKGKNVEPEEIFKLLKDNMTHAKKLMTALYFVDSFPVTPSGKIHRSKVREMALKAEKTLSD